MRAMQLASYSTQHRTPLQRSPAAPRTPLEPVSFLNSQLTGVMHDGVCRSSNSHMRLSAYPLDRSPSCCNAIDGIMWYERSEVSTPHHGPTSHNWSHVVPLLSICASDYDLLPPPSPEVGRRGGKEAEMVWLVNQNDVSLRSAIQSLSATSEKLKPNFDTTDQAAVKPQPKRFHPTPTLWHSLPPPISAHSTATVVPVSTTNFAQVTSLSDDLPLNGTAVPYNVNYFERLDDTHTSQCSVQGGTHAPYIMDGADKQPTSFHEENSKSERDIKESAAGDFWGKINLACPLGHPLSTSPSEQLELSSFSTFRS